MLLCFRKASRKMLCRILGIIVILLSAIKPNNSDAVDFKMEQCRKISSCSSCIELSFCTWCVTKSKCSKQSCGNDNIIYPKGIPALMGGPQFCPRVVEPEGTLVIKSGAKQAIAVKITQIHLYMAFTPWKCKIMLEGVPEKTVIAMLIGDKVYCESTKFINHSNQPYASGSVSILWDYTKMFDGSLMFKVCRCDLDPACSACN